MVNNFGENHGVIAENIYGDIKILSDKKKIPSLLPKFIEMLVKNYSPVIENGNSYNNKPYTIEEKIEYNNIIFFKEMIDEYYVYYPICELAFDSLRNIDENCKRNILEDIHVLYKNIKFEIFEECRESSDPLDELKVRIKKQSDKIISLIIDKVKCRIESSYNGENFNLEELSMCLNIFICYALGECKILERPV
ncbi:hypothetical protein [Metasolibacillus sp. FSL K6-0083]|uniref:hypothetical protein n=1 Tax=Metasolibacillus sp. FSL K6-0083 TaxID=2921416 RepID=UPI00315A7E49